MDIVIYRLTAKIIRMSGRRQKKAFAKQSPTRLTNVYPTAVSELGESQPTTLDVTFSYQPKLLEK